jgi:hypothetical protein
LTDAKALTDCPVMATLAVAQLLLPWLPVLENGWQSNLALFETWRISDATIDEILFAGD